MTCFYHRGVAQAGSALDWGSRGRWFKSSRPDWKCKGSKTQVFGPFLFVLRPQEKHAKCRSTTKLGYCQFPFAIRYSSALIFSGQHQGLATGDVCGMKTTGFGPHLMLDLNDCDVELLSDLDHCARILNDLPDHIGMTKITQPYCFRYSGLVPEDEGITGMVIIAESHISIHTFPIKSYAFIDVFSCRDFDVNEARDYLIEAFKSRDPQTFVTERGLKFPRTPVPLKAHVSNAS